MTQTSGEVIAGWQARHTNYVNNANFTCVIVVNGSVRSIGQRIFADTSDQLSIVCPVNVPVDWIVGQSNRIGAGGTTCEQWSRVASC